MNDVREEETLRLETIKNIAENQMCQIREAMEKQKEEMIEAKKQARDNTTFGLGDLSNPEAFEAFIEISQSMSHVDKIISDYDEAGNNLLRLENLVKKPYFARIDFRFQDGETEKIYIGRTSLTDAKSTDIYIYDWRSPIAGMFYRFLTGPAFYDAPCGKIEGDILLKRQFEIQDGKLKFFFDSDVNVQDEILRKILSQNTSAKMKAIVETIQKDQDEVIRNMKNDLLMVQGVAGSGKTSIALHRAAYLMYQGLQSKITAENIMIISPNTNFEDYISEVLPELGEENITSIVFDNLLKEIIRDKSIQSQTEYLEKVIAQKPYGKELKENMEIKTSENFLRVLEKFLQDIPETMITYQDITYHGNCVVDQNTLKERLVRREDVPLGMRLKQLETFVMERVFGTGKKHGSREEIERLHQMVSEMMISDVQELYKKMYKTDIYRDMLISLGEDATKVNRVWRDTKDNLEYWKLEIDDAIAIAYLTVRIFGYDKYRNMKQIVIDEAQDYYPMQYELIRYMFPNARFTVLGDMNQTLAKEENITLYDMIQRRLNKSNALLITLDKSFRCTSEILQFSLQFIAHRPEIQSFNRSGDVPQIVEIESEDKWRQKVLEELEYCKEIGYKKIGLLCKTGEKAEAIYQELKDVTKLSLVLGGKDSELSDVTVMPVYLSKGLEFDAVLICDADVKTYCSAEDKKLLYVEATRALHRLTVFAQGKSAIGE